MTARAAATGPLTGRVAIITGAGHGIGKEYAGRLAREGASVVLEDRAAAMRADGLAAMGIRADVRDERDLRAVAAAAKDSFGRIDVLVNNAALFATVPMSRAPFDQIEIEEWDRMMAINLRGPWLASRAVFPVMRDQHYGKIINISSATALKGSASRIHYVTSKAGVLGFTKVLAREVGPFGITVNCIAPGSTLSEESPDAQTLAMRKAGANDRAIQRVQVPEDLAGAVVFLSSSASDFITGQTLVVDGGSYLH